MRNSKILILLLFVLFVSCDEEEKDLVENRAELLAGSSENGRSYSIESAEIDGEDAKGIVTLDECITDNTRIYFPDGKYEENEGREKCDPNDPAASVGTWKLNDDNSQLSISTDQGTDVWNIVSISSTTHRLTKADGDRQVTSVLVAL